MTPSARRVALVMAGAVLAVGLLVGFMPTASGGVNCGSAFIESRDAAIADLTDTFDDTLDAPLGSREAACEDRRSLLRIPAIALTALGAAGLFAAFLSDDQAPWRRSTVK